MTRQYLIGELSSLLGELQAAARSASAEGVADLRREAETGPPTALSSTAARALEEANRMSWDSLVRGDSAAFVRQVAICGELWEFGVSAGLFEERLDW
jgi:hypothetical protein